MVNPSRLYKICKAFHAAAADTLIPKTQEMSDRDVIETIAPQKDIAHTPTLPSPDTVKGNQPTLLSGVIEPEDDDFVPLSPRVPQIKHTELPVDRAIMYEELPPERKQQLHQKYQKEKHEREIKELKKQMDELLEETKELHR